VRAAPLEQLLALSWLPEHVARAVYDRVHDNGRPAPRALVGAADAQ
jgi:hypothetical protein